MAVDFPSDDQAAGFGRFRDEVSAEDLERFCWLDDADLSVIGRRRVERVGTEFRGEDVKGGEGRVVVPLVAVGLLQRVDGRERLGAGERLDLGFLI